MKNSQTTVEEEFVEEELFKKLRNFVLKSFDLKPKYRESDATNKGKLLTTMIEEYAFSSENIEKMLCDLPPQNRDKIYRELNGITTSLVGMTSIVTSLLPPDKDVNCYRMEKVRKKRPEEEEFLILDAFDQWKNSSLTVFKLSEASSADLKQKGISISPKALRDRFKRMNRDCSMSDDR